MLYSKERNDKFRYIIQSLKLLCQDHCLIGAKLDYEMFPVMKKSTKERVYEMAEGEGIHPRYMYSVLDVREISKIDDGGNSGPL